MPAPSIHSLATTVHSASDSVGSHWSTIPSHDISLSWSPLLPIPWMYIIIHQTNVVTLFSPHAWLSFMSPYMWNDSFGMPQPLGCVQQKRLFMRNLASILCLLSFWQYLCLPRMPW